VFRYLTTKNQSPSLSFEIRPARGFVSIQPTHRLELRPDGWRLRSEIRVTPIRTALDQLALILPRGWTEPRVLPFERVEEVLPVRDATRTGTHLIRLANTEREPVTLILESRFPLATTATELKLDLPRFPDTEEGDTQIIVQVQDGLTLRGQVRELLGGVETTVPLQPRLPIKAGLAVTQLAGSFDIPVVGVDLTWQPFRPELTSDVRADLSFGERQVTVTQTIRIQASDPITRSIRLKGPKSALAFQSSIPLEQTLGGWSLTPPTEAREIVLTCSFALNLPGRSPDGSPVKLEIPFLCAESARTTASVRLWGTGLTGRRPRVSEGAWAERPIEPVPERDILPWMALDHSHSQTIPNLTLDLWETAETASVIVERSVIRVSPMDDGSWMVRARWLLKRWSTGSLDVAIPTAASPSVWVGKDRVDPIPLGKKSEPLSHYRVSLPEPKGNRGSLLVEVQYPQLTRPRLATVTLTPPEILNATTLIPTIWGVALPVDQISLVWRGILLDYRWPWYRDRFFPAARLTSLDLEQWLSSGTLTSESDRGLSDLTIVGRQSSPTSIEFTCLPRIPFLILSSILIMCLAWLVLSRRGRVWCVIWCLATGLVTLTAILLVPQPTLAILTAATPGLIAGVFGYWTATLRQWLAQRRTRYLGSFQREPSRFSRSLSTASARSAGVILPASSSRSSPVPPPGANG
jgi:hypothetical protein